MRGFTSRSTVETAQSWIDTTASCLDTERVPLDAGAGRVLAVEIMSQVDVPGFDRSMMDGFAVRAEDTEGASIYNRLPLEIVGESMPGQPFPDLLLRRQAVRIMTGAPIPAGANAVIPVERVIVEEERVLAQDAVPPRKHVGEQGEDVTAGTSLLVAGRRLRPQDIGLISSVGIAEIEVVRRPRVRILVTGNELLPAGSQPRGCRIADANGPMLEALVERDGAVVSNPGIVPDEPEAILEALRDSVDVVLVSGGSSVGKEDHAPGLLADHGELAIHGVAMRPSSPAGMGRLDARLVFLLPGNPVSCLCAYDFFAGRAIRSMGGLDVEWPYHARAMRLTRKLVSVVGRVDYARVRIVDDGIEPLAISGASVLSSTSRADGFVVVPAESEGLPPGATADVFLYDVP